MNGLVRIAAAVVAGFALGSAAVSGWGPWTRVGWLALGLVACGVLWVIWRREGRDS